jgi:hypothetical protein
VFLPTLFSLSVSSFFLLLAKLLGFRFWSESYPDITKGLFRLGRRNRKMLVSEIWNFLGTSRNSRRFEKKFRYFPNLLMLAINPSDPCRAESTRTSPRGFFRRHYVDKWLLKERSEGREKIRWISNPTEKKVGKKVSPRREDGRLTKIYVGS